MIFWAVVFSALSLGALGILVMSNARTGAQCTVGAYLFILALVLIFMAVPINRVFAHEHGRSDASWEELSPEEKAWFKWLTRPDMPPGYSCCGESDHYWCDGLKVSGDAVFCQITDDRPDDMFMDRATGRKREHVPVGTWIQIPPEKMKFGPNDPQRPPSNPTGHAIVFLSSSRSVFCFIPSTGI